MPSELHEPVRPSQVFPPLSERPVSFFDRLHPPKIFTSKDIGDENAKHYYFPSELIEMFELKSALQAVARFIPDKEHGYKYPAGGTCFFVGNFLITQAHCVLEKGMGPVDERRIILSTREEVSLKGAKPKFVPTEYRPGKDDIAIYDISEVEDLRFVPIVPLALEDPQLGDPVFSIGYPWVIDNGQTEVMSYGAIQEIKEDGTFVYDCETTQGQSGGPLLNRRGEVVGIVWRLAQDGQVGFTESRIVGLAVSHVREYLRGNK